MRVERYKQGRYFALYDASGKLVVVTVYKRGAVEVKRRLSLMNSEAAESSAASTFFLTLSQEQKEESSIH